MKTLWIICGLAVLSVVLAAPSPKAKGEAKGKAKGRDPDLSSVVDDVDDGEDNKRDTSAVEDKSAPVEKDMPKLPEAAGKKTKDSDDEKSGEDKREKRAAARRLASGSLSFWDGALNTSCGFGKAGGCEDNEYCNWSQYNTSIMCTAKDATFVTKYGFTCADRDEILRIHNDHRRNQSGIPDSAAEQKLYWDHCLAQQAQKLAQSCVFDHDSGAQRVYPNGGPTPGQNLGWGSSWLSVINAWFGEVINFQYGASNNPALVGHFTMAMKAGTARIGCGYAYCKNEMMPGYYVCNYANGQTASDIKAPYPDGEPCSKCPNHCAADKKSCDCKGKMCHHYGSLDPATCQCTCKTPFAGDPECKYLNKEWKDKVCAAAENSACGAEPYTKGNCCNYSNLYTVCPHTCGICDADVDMGNPVGCSNGI